MHGAAKADASGFRDEVRESARRFKASWVELARQLYRVRGERLFAEWGFDSFEAYCADELHLKKATAHKLVMSFGFLARREPDVVRGGERERPAPAFELVEVLSRAEEKGQLDDRTYEEVRERLWEQPIAPADLRRELARRQPEASTAEEPAPVDLTLKRLGAAAKKLARELAACEKVPRTVVDRAEKLAAEVSGLAKRP